jgi:hypothetical protein
MRLLRNVGIPLAAILILLILLLAVVVLIYKQNGLMLPFSRNSDFDGAEETESNISGIEYKNQNLLFRIGGNINDKALPHPSY